MSTNTFTKPIQAATASEYGEALGQITEKLQQIEKNITYLDAYNITTAVTSEKDFPSIRSLLTPGSALVINTDYSFEFNGEKYRVGDVVLRIATGEWVHIRAQVGGLYYPKQLVKNNDGSYEIHYAYQAASPEKDDSTVTHEDDSNIWEVQGTPGKTITFNVAENTTTEETVYGIWEQFSPALQEQDDGSFAYVTPVEGGIQSYHFDFKVAEKKIYDETTDDEITVEIQPLIKFFIVDSEASMAEELLIAYRLMKVTDKDGVKWWRVCLFDDWSSNINPETWNLYYMVK